MKIKTIICAYIYRYMGKYESKQVAIKTLIGESFSESHIMNFKSEFEILW